MKKLRITLILLTLIAASSWIVSLSTFAKTAEPIYSDDYQQTLEYRVTEWNGTNAVEWYVWDYVEPIHRGFAGSEVDGKMVVNITGLYNETFRLSYLSNPEPVPYGDISFYWQNEDLNFTATNISNTEMAYVLNLGYMNWFPGFITPLDWEQNAALALAQRDVWGILCNVKVINQTDAVIYYFKQQTGSILQNTTLRYDLSTGVLISAYTEFGNYWCRIIPYGPKSPSPPAQEIPGYSIPIIGGVTVFTTLGFVIAVQKIKRNEKK